MLPGTDDRTLDRGRRSHRGHGAAGSGRELRHRRAPRRLLPRTEGHRRRVTRSSSTRSRGRTSIASSARGWSTRRTSRCWIPTPTPALTLVTCYPFYFVGSAPQRFIVRAVRVGDNTMSSRQSADAFLVFGVEAGGSPPCSGLCTSRQCRASTKQNGESYDTRNGSDGAGRSGRVLDGRGVAGSRRRPRRKPRASRSSRWTATRWSSGCRKARGS